MLRQITGSETTYKLTLSDGKIWGFSATETILPWFEELREIMNLEPSSQEAADFKIVFLALNEENLHPYDDVNDWSIYKQGRAIRLWFHSSKPETFVELNKDFIDHPELKIVNMILTLRTIFRYYTRNGGSPIHTAFAEYNGKGILITAASGTGKSTCSKRFPDHWKSLCDDTALILKDKSNFYRVHPMPTWSDHLWGTRFSTYQSSYSLPLSAIFFLQQGQKDEIVQVRKAEAIQRIYEALKQVWERC